MADPDARRRAEEALAEWKRAWILGCADTPAGVATAAIALKSGLEALLDAAPEAPQSAEVREAAEAKATALLGSARHYFAQGHPMREAIDEHLAALRGGQKGGE